MRVSPSSSIVPIQPAALDLLADLEDVRSLWRIRGKQMDAERIDRTLKLLEEALSQSDLVPTFERIRLGG